MAFFRHSTHKNENFVKEIKGRIYIYILYIYIYKHVWYGTVKKIFTTRDCVSGGAGSSGGEYLFYCTISNMLYIYI